MGKETHYDALDGLRGFAALTVAIAHFSSVTGLFGGMLGKGGGQVGVFLFFVLSGYLMGKLYLPLPVTAQNIVEFYRRRIARVVPLYLFAVLVSYVTLLVSGSNFPFYPIYNANILQHLLFIKGDMIFWTVAVECQFYLIFPVFWVARTLLGPRLSIMVFVASAVALLTFHGEFGTLSHHLPAFLIGMLASFVPARSVRGADLAFLVLLIGYFLIFPQIKVATGLGIKTPVWHDPPYYIVVPGLLMAAASSSLANAWLGGAVGRFFGRISYSFYIWHFVLISLMVKNLPLADTLPFYAIVYLLLATALAWVSYHAIELPAQRLILSAPVFGFGMSLDRHDQAKKKPKGMRA